MTHRCIQTPYLRIYDMYMIVCGSFGRAARLAAMRAYMVIAPFGCSLRAELCRQVGV